MDEELKNAILAMLESQRVEKQADAQKAADDARKAELAQFVTTDALKGLFEEFASKLTENLQAKIDAAIPVRAEGAGRAAEGTDAQKANDPVEAVKALVSTPLDKLTDSQKQMKAEMFARELSKGLKKA